MSDSKNDISELLIKAAIWFGSAIVSIPLMAILTGNTSSISYIVSFMLPAITIFATIRVYQGKEIFSFFKGLFKKGNTESKPSGKLAFPVALLIYGFIGFISGILFEASFFRVIIIHTIVGIFWGYCVSLLIKNGVFTIDDV